MTPIEISLNYRIQHRADTAANWTSEDPELLLGEIGIETDTLKWKIGDGSTEWSSLDYAMGSLTATAFIQTLLDDADAATARSTLGAGSASDVATNTSHRGLTSGNPHSVSKADLSLDTDDDVEFQSVTINGDNDADDVAYVRPIVFLTDGDGDPTWSDYPEGTVFMWKEA